MILIAAAAFLAGILTILAPCVAPVVSLVLGAASTGGRRRSLGILAGFGLSFLVVTIVLASALAGAGLATDKLRIASAIFLGLVGLAIAVPWIGSRLGASLAPVAVLGTGVARRRPGDGLVGGLVLGAAIGLIWAPCVGPIMAGVIAAAAVGGPSADTLIIAGSYVVGFLIPLGLVARFGSRAAATLSGKSRRGRARQVLGVVMLAGAVLVLSGQDLVVENGLAAVLPSGLGSVLTSVEPGPAGAGGLAVAGSLPPGSGDSADGLPGPVAVALPGPIALDDLGPAPEFTGIQAWINADPLTMASLHGKVVLVEFWTFACINCIHVQPYVTAWSDRYAAAGLVVVGVHTPELSFERDLGNVRDAVAKGGIPYPVAVDAGFATWNAFHNGAWPSLYFIDRSGRIRHTHGGEGAYDVSEQVIRELLAAPS
jgi:cytochrome c biogenesis protein CcdA/thiol-disulfide isomerase/thioredoxin